MHGCFENLAEEGQLLPSSLEQGMAFASPTFYRQGAGDNKQQYERAPGETLSSGMRAVGEGSKSVHPC
jgi:hypothetical protein